MDAWRHLGKWVWHTLPLCDTPATYRYCVVDTELNPLQQAVISALGVPTDWEPLSIDIVESIEEQLVEALAPIKDLFTPENPLRVNKHHIATVHGCEKYHVLNRQAQFAWNINTVRGTIAHKGIELLLSTHYKLMPTGHMVRTILTCLFLLTNSHCNS